MRIKIEARR